MQGRALAEMNKIVLSDNLKDELKSILGDDYERIEEFYRQACITSNYEFKVFLTRRSYVLYRIFLSIFTDENPEFHVFGQIFNTHSLCKLISPDYPTTNSRVLVLDDIIINGRTVKNVLNQLTESEKFEKIGIWCIVCNTEAKFLDRISDYINHVEYVTGSEWKILSNKLTKFIVASNIGYVSFVNSFYLNSTTSQYIKEKVLTPESYLPIISLDNKLLQELNINANIILYNFYGDLNKKYDLHTCIRIYEKNAQLTVIPYVFIASVYKNGCIEYCKKLLGEFNLTIPESLVFHNSEKLIYQWTINQLSFKLYDCFLKDVFGNYSGCVESYKIGGSQESTIYHNLEYTSPEITECCNLLIKAKNAVNQEGSKDLGYMLKKYLTAIHELDETKALSDLPRSIGIRVKDIFNIFNQDISSEELTKVVLKEIISSWDIGMSSYVVEEVKTNDNRIIIDGFIRNGEQTYRGYYELNNLQYLAFYEYFLATCEYKKEALLDLAAYLDDKMKTRKFTEFIDHLSTSSYLEALKSIEPNRQDEAYFEVKRHLNDYLSNY